MGTEQKVSITANGKWNNINFKSDYKKGITGLDPGNFCYVTKSFAAGKPFVKEYPNPDGTKTAVTSYICGVEYEGTKCSFFLKGKEHDEFKDCGGIGDKVKVTLEEVPKVNGKGQKVVYQVLHFEAA